MVIPKTLYNHDPCFQTMLYLTVYSQITQAVTARITFLMPLIYVPLFIQTNVDTVDCNGAWGAKAVTFGWSTWGHFLTGAEIFFLPHHPDRLWNHLTFCSAYWTVSKGVNVP